MQTQARRAKIRELVLSHDIESQEELTGLLGEAGYETTQSTLSRDLAGLGIAKRRGHYQLLQDPRDRWLQIGYRSAMAAGPNMLVVKTEIGAAQRVASLIDQAEIPGIVGTLAGDDTIFLAIESAEQQGSIINALESGI